MRLFAVFALVALAGASCPNMCSGHGRCGDFDKCACFRSGGLGSPYRFSYTGADCSQRTCPIGIAYDAITTAAPKLSAVMFKAATAASKPKLRAIYSAGGQSNEFKALKRDQKFEVRIMSATTFTWRMDEDEYFQDETNIDASNTMTTARALNKVDGNVNSGVSVYFDEDLDGTHALTTVLNAGDSYTFTLTQNEGVTFDESNSNTAHQETMCSGRGTCDFTLGKCQCHEGYTGSACERTECVNSCSGHGTCQSESRFVTDAKILDGKYDLAYDGQQQYGCRCDVGYRGVDCSLMECPSGIDPLGGEGGAGGRDCSGRGLCDYSTGLCKCFKGYVGESCNVQSTFV